MQQSSIKKTFFHQFSRRDRNPYPHPQIRILPSSPLSWRLVRQQLQVQPMQLEQQPQQICLDPLNKIKKEKQNRISTIIQTLFLKKVFKKNLISLNVLIPIGSWFCPGYPGNYHSANFYHHEYLTIYLTDEFSIKTLP